MKRNTESQRSKKIKELKPRRQPKNQEETQFQKDLKQLLKLRTQSQILRQASRKTEENVREKVLKIPSYKSYLQVTQKRVQKYVLQKILLQKPQIMQQIPELRQRMRVSLNIVISTIETFIELMGLRIEHDSFIYRQRQFLVNRSQDFDREESDNQSIDTIQQMNQSQKETKSQSIGQSENESSLRYQHYNQHEQNL